MKRKFGIKSTIVFSFLLSSDDSKYSREWDISIFREIDEEEIFHFVSLSLFLSLSFDLSVTMNAREKFPNGIVKLQILLNSSYKFRIIIFSFRPTIYVPRK